MDHGEVAGLLAAGELFEVLEHDHPTFGWYLAFDDELAYAHDAALDALVADLTGLEWVARAHREDREVVLVAPARPDDATVGQLLAVFLEHELDELPGNREVHRIDADRDQQGTGRGDGSQEGCGKTL